MGAVHAGGGVRLPFMPVWSVCDYADNSIGEAGAQHIAEKLAVNTTLVTLFLGGERRAHAGLGHRRAGMLV